MSKLAPLPPTFHSQAPGAREYTLALVQLPNDEFWDEETSSEFARTCYSVPSMLLNVEYKAGNYDAVTLLVEENGKKEDVGKSLVSDGYALVEKRREKRLQDLVI